jgi:hypothetical protein
MEQFTTPQKKDIKVLIAFTATYCRARHGERAPFALPEDLAGLLRRDVELCPDCARFLAYALERRRKCPLDPKPTCKRCRIHCYSQSYRAKVREIMAFSGRRMILRGRLDYLWHYLF